MKQSFRRNKITGLCLLAALIFSLALAGVNALAADEAAQSNTERLYALTLNTGTSTGTSGVSTFRVSYVDTDGVSRSQYIVPNSSTIASGNSYLNQRNLTTINSRLKRAKENLGFQLNTFTDEGELNSASGALVSQSSVTLLSKFDYEVDYVTDISVFLHSQDGTPARWNCAGLRFSKVSEAPVVKMYGFYSANTYLDYSSQTLAEMTSNYYFSTTSSSVFHITTKNQLGYNEKYALIRDGVSVVEENADDNNQFIFRLDLADTWGAGIETYKTPENNKKSISQMRVPETLYYNIRYLDAYGVTREVALPVLSSTLGWATENGIDAANTYLTDFAGQGDSLVFVGTLPYFRSFIKVELVYSTTGSDIFRASDLLTFSTEQKQLLASIHDTEDSISYTGMSIYRVSDNCSASVIYENGTRLVPKVTGSPMVYFASNDAEGITQNPGTTRSIELIAYKDGAQLTPSASISNQYLVSITTDDVELAGSTSNIFMSLKYTDVYGNQLETEQFDLQKLSRDFYGYWAGMNGSEVLEDFGYYSGITAGNTLHFIVTIQKAATFEGVNFDMSGGDDEWQISSMQIRKLTAISERKASWTSVSAGKFTSNRRYYRTVGATDVTDLDIDDENSDDSAAPNDETDTDGTSGNGSSSGESSGDGSGSGGSSGDGSSSGGSSGDGSSSGGTSGGGTNSGTGIHIDGINIPDIDFNGHALIRSGEITVINFGDTDKPVINHNDGKYISKDTVLTDYSQTQEDYGFNKARRTYLVDVQVAGDSNASTDNDDSGSLNYFYFQLIFENGNSGYVLANQQLEADGFRAGTHAAFSISTNEDFGELTSVNILPDDITEGSNIYDKLNIDNISVSESEIRENNRTWEITDVGWIGIDYKEEGDGTAKNTGRTTDELVHNYPVSGSGDNTSVQFSIMTAEAEADAATGQFQGTIQANIQYQKNNGTYDEMNINVVDAMNSYYGLAKNTGSLQTDPNYMCRPGSVDRFIVQLKDLKAIRSITFTVTGSIASSWKIKSVSAGAITSYGNIMINNQGEYQTTAQVKELARSVPPASQNYVTLAVTAGGQASYRFVMNTIRNSEAEDETEDEIIETDGSGDTMNLFVKMTENGSASSINATVHYTDTAGNLKGSTRNLSSEGSGFYMTGLGAPNLCQVKRVILKANDGSNAAVDYVIIQHIRNGMVLETSKIDFAGQNVSEESVSTSVTVLTKSGEKQVVSFVFGNSTDTELLTEGEQDLAVSIEYISTYLENQTFRSEYLLLSNQQVKQIKAGKIVDVTFRELGVKEITAIHLRRQGDFSATISRAYAAIYLETQEEQKEADSSNENDKNVDVLRQWYSFETSEEYTIGTTDVGLPVTGIGFSTANTVIPVELTIETGDAQTKGESGTDNPIRMSLRYQGYEGDIKEYTLRDITDYVTEGDFETGSTAKVRLLIPDFAKPVSITLTPYQTSSNANISAKWRLGSITLKRMTKDGEKTSSRRVDRWLSEDNSSSILLLGYDFSLDVIGKTGTTHTYSDIDPNRTYHADSDGETIIMRYTLTGIPETLDRTMMYEVREIVSGESISLAAAEEVSSLQTKTFTVPTAGTTARKFQIVWWLKADPSMEFTLDVTTPAVEEPEEEPEEEPDYQNIIYEAVNDAVNDTINDARSDADNQDVYEAQNEDERMNETESSSESYEAGD